jgi:soluble lytic murein transglycosylase-like protein
LNKKLAGLTLVGPLLYSSVINAGLQGPRRVSIDDIKTQAKVVALKHGLSSDLYLNIIRVESNFKPHAYNNRTQDVGLAQVNKHTARAFGLNLIRLKHDYKYNLNAGAIILADFRRRYEARNPRLWPCRYNVGSGLLIGPKLVRCLVYLKRVNAAK